MTDFRRPGFPSTVPFRLRNVKAGVGSIQLGSFVSDYEVNQA